MLDQILLAEEGEAEATFNHRSFLVKRGDLVLKPAGTLFSVQSVSKDWKKIRVQAIQFLYPLLQKAHRHDAGGVPEQYRKVEKGCRGNDFFPPPAAERIRILITFANPFRGNGMDLYSRHIMAADH